MSSVKLNLRCPETRISCNIASSIQSERPWLRIELLGFSRKSECLIRSGYTPPLIALIGCKTKLSVESANLRAVLPKHSLIELTEVNILSERIIRECEKECKHSNYHSVSDSVSHSDIIQAL
jgi:hypothetical protein